MPIASENFTPATLFVDFETRSEFDLRNGLWGYSNHASTRVLCMAYCFDYGPIELWTPTDGDLPAAIVAHIKKGMMVSAFNAQFEWRIWNDRCVELYGWPELPIEQCKDTMAQVSACALPQSLAGSGEALRLDASHLKNPRGKYLIQRLCIPRKPTKHNKEIWNNDPRLLSELFDYCRQDVEAERSISAAVPELSAFEQRVWVETCKMNERGIPIAVDEVTELYAVVEDEKEHLNNQLAELTYGAVSAASKRDALLRWINEQNFEMTGLTVADVNDALQRDPPPEVERALRIRQSVSKTSTAKLAKILDIHHDGRLHGMFVYHGASTGRWASRGGFNMQNIARPRVDPEVALPILLGGDRDFMHMMYGDDVIEAISSCLRAMVKAPLGLTFTDIDFSSIENRVAPWLSGDEDHLDLFRNGLDEYKDFATSMYPVQYDEVTKDQRQVAKSAVLGCVFGQGAIGLTKYAANFGVTLEEHEAKEIVQTYRIKRASIASMWRRCGNAAMSAVRDPKGGYKVGDYLTFFMEGDFLKMQLPSGRLISYHLPMVEEASVPWSDTETRPVVTFMGFDNHIHKYCRTKAIGSSIFQSAVQGTARDLLAEAFVRLIDGGYDVRGLFHDEALSLNDDDYRDDVTRIMTEVPRWAEGLPVDAAGWCGTRYRKD